MALDMNPTLRHFLHTDQELRPCSDGIIESACPPDR
jgi:hypothetical protein